MDGLEEVFGKSWMEKDKVPLNLEARQVDGAMLQVER